MDIVRRIVAGAAERLTDDGLLIVEIGNERNSRKPPSVNWA
jgi:ribosomal protein L3 glutamine methyltransferase